MLSGKDELTERRFGDILKSASRWFELAIELGWLGVLIADWMPVMWFTSANKEEWKYLRDSLFLKGQCLREMVREHLGKCDEWLMTAPICTPSPRVELTSR
jgi:hypothetical protein